DPWLDVRTPAPSERPAAAPAEIADPYVEFPLDQVPPVMSLFASELSRTVCVDPSLGILPMLSLAGAAIGNTARARMSGDYAAPAVVWSAVLARSGERKS